MQIDINGGQQVQIDINYDRRAKQAKKFKAVEAPLWGIFIVIL